MPLSELPPGVHVTATYDGDPVELVRTDSGVVARSLLCTHFGCRLRWHPEESRYVCACHGGVFDADGRPIAGPPSRSLRPVSFQIEDEVVVVGEP